ncbi:MAG: P-II family nitrogen regulator [Nitrospirota bacterium]|nr:P-II family nitrogen regulator [Nitrospirota bacterium]
MQFSAIIAMVPARNEKVVINAARKEGATGVSILNTRGEGVVEKSSFFGLSLESPYNCLIFLVNRMRAAKILLAIEEAGEMQKDGNGLCFSLPVDEVRGLNKQLKVLMKEVRDDYF